jgi:hypothetical protein
LSKQIIIIASILGAVLAVGAVIIGMSAVKRAAQPTSIKSTTLALPQAAGVAQLSDGGGVQIQVNYDPKQPADGVIRFQVAMNTHSVELSQFDLGKLTRLTLEPGGELIAATWKPEGNGGGHHVSGELTVPDPTGLITKAKSLKLELRDVAGEASRQFQWQLSR